MTTITIPNNLRAEKDLVVIPRLQYENFLKYLTNDKDFESLWNNAVKEAFLESYSKSDSIYDQI